MVNGCPKETALVSNPSTMKPMPINWKFGEHNQIQQKKSEKCTLLLCYRRLNQKGQFHDKIDLPQKSTGKLTAQIILLAIWTIDAAEAIVMVIFSKFWHHIPYTIWKVTTTEVFWLEMESCPIWIILNCNRLQFKSTATCLVWCPCANHNLSMTNFDSSVISSVHFIQWSRIYVR